MDNIVFRVPTEELAHFAQRWRIREIALFGSVLRSDFRLESDVDVLVTFDEPADWGLLAHVQMQQELEAIFGRSVDLVSRKALEGSANWLRRNNILKSAQVIYSADTASEARHAA